jgi:hypothetical protein
VILTAFLSLALGGCEWLFRDKTPVYEITFIYYNGEPNTVINVKRGESIYAPPQPKKEGYKFDAWYTDAGFTSLFKDGTAASSNLALHAKYREIYTVSGGVYDFFSGEPIGGCFVVGTGEYASGTKITLSASLIVGYVFEGFYLNGNRISSADVVSATVNSNAVYDIKVKKGCFIRVEIGEIAGGRVKINGLDSPSLSLLEGGLVEIRAEVFVGYNFEGFYDAEGNLYTDELGFEIKLTNDAVFTAEFSYIDCEITAVSSDDALGTVTVSPPPDGRQFYRVGDTVTITATPILGNVLKGLFVEAGGAIGYLSSSRELKIKLADLINGTGGAYEFKIVAEFEAADFSSENYIYQKIGDTARITGIDKPFDTGNVYVPESFIYVPDINFPEQTQELPVTEISSSAFAGRGDVIRLYLPSSLESFTGNTNPFEYCQNLEAVSVAANNAYFSSADGVLFNKNATAVICYPAAKPDQSYTAPSSAAEIGAAAFGGQRFLKNFSAAGLKTVSSFAFRNAAVESFSVVGSPSSFNVGEFAFLNCQSLSSVHINLTGTGNGTYKISSFAFSGCRNLAEVVLNGIKTLNEEIFSGCYALAEITLPKSLTTVVGDAFGGSGLTNIYVDSASAAFEGVDGVLYNRTEKSLVRCPERHINSVIVKAGTVSIGGYAFKNASLITSVDLASASVASIGIEAFMNASAMYDFNMGTKVKTIGDYGFFGCLALPALTASGTLETVGEYAFSESGIVVLDMGNGLKKAAATAFNNMRELETVDFPNTVTDLGERYGGIDGEIPIFVNCPKLLEINVAAGGTTVYTSSEADEGDSKGILYKGTWYGSGTEKYFVAGEMVARCPEGKTGLVTVKSKEMQKIASGAFSNSKAARVLFDFDGAPSQKLYVIGRQAFSFAESLTEIALPSSVLRIGDDAFLGCKALATVLLQNGLERIGDFAFSGCALEEITIPESVQYVYAFAFYGNPKLKNVYMRRTTAPATSTFRGSASIFDGHNPTFKIHIIRNADGSSNISNYSGKTGWSEYGGCYADWTPSY